MQRISHEQYEQLGPGTKAMYYPLCYHDRVAESPENAAAEKAKQKAARARARDIFDEADIGSKIDPAIVPLLDDNRQRQLWKNKIGEVQTGRQDFEDVYEYIKVDLELRTQLMSQKVLAEQEEKRTALTRAQREREEEQAYLRSKGWAGGAKGYKSRRKSRSSRQNKRKRSTRVKYRR